MSMGVLISLAAVDAVGRAGVLAALEAADHILITSHARPDGDAIGSALGMAHILRSIGKHPQVAFADPIPTIFSKLPGVDDVVFQLPATNTLDTLLVLECDSFGRTGFAADVLSSLAPRTVNIDHHQSGRPFAAANWIDPRAAAVGVMVYDLAESLGATVGPDAATCLYAALITDTGSFSYQTTRARTFETAARLMHAGADAYGVSRQVFSSNSIARARLLSIVLSRISIDRSFAWSHVTLEDMAAAGADAEACEGLINHLINLDGVEAAAFLRQVPGNDVLRCSLRSKGNVDVASIAETFGGGGHRNASGCSIELPLQTAVARLLASVEAAVRLDADPAATCKVAAAAAGRL